MATTQPASSRTTLASAPGKVLIAGGYLVLDPAYPGLVISTDSRFYSLARSSHSEDDGAASEPTTAPGGIQQHRITVHSPQFVDAEWVYIASMDAEGGWHLEQTRDSHAKAGRNPFVSLAILYTVRLAAEILGNSGLHHVLSSTTSSGGDGIEITVLGDNDFYSQRDSLSLSASETPTIAALESLPPFARQTCRIGDVHKTGLGSSAAMTTSLVGCLLTHLGAVEREEGNDGQLTTPSLALVHNLAQLAHCAAQGKVGSGFDVSAAVWGSQLYRRFDPAVLKPCLEEGLRVGVEGEEPQADQTASRQGTPLTTVLDPLNPLWRPSPLSSAAAEGQTSSYPTAIEGLASTPNDGLPTPAPLSLPPGFDMVLADVDAGSNTPSLVSKVLAWRAAKPTWAAQLYAVLASSNASLADHFLNLRMMHDADPEVYDEVLARCAACKAKEWDAMLKDLPPPPSGPEAGDGAGENEKEEEEEVEVTPHTVLSVLIEVRNTLRAVRAGMRELGTRSGAPVEPSEMGRLIHRVAEHVDGLLGGGVPGAGGYDALFLLYLVPRQERQRDPRLEIQDFWQRAQREQDEEGGEHEKREGELRLNIGPLLSRAGSARGLGGEHGEHGGFRIERPEEVRGLLEAIGSAA